MKTKLLIAILLLGYKMSFAQTTPSYLPKNGLVGWWPFNGNANDESGNNNHGVVTGATLTTDRNGQANSAYSFDGNSQNILLNKNLNSNITNTITIAFWVKIPYDGGGIAIVQNNNKSPYNTLFAVSTSQNYHQYIFYGDNCNDKASLNFYKNQNSNINDNWNLLVYTIDSKNSLKLFFNGKFVGEKNDGLFSNSCYENTKLRFGGDWVSNDPQWFKGIIDDISIYNRALSQQEISQIYTGCPKEIASSNSFNSTIYTTSPILSLTAQPTGGKFSGEAISANQFLPTKAKLGKNIVKYNFINSKGCSDSTLFSTVVSDTIGNTCSTYDTLKIKVKLTTGIKTGQFTSMNVYPNPTSDVLIIEANDINGLKGYTYKIVDLQGKEIYKSLISSAKTEIALKSIGAKGIYILHIIDEVGQSIENKKIILE